jgi:hypothetical protein
MIDNGVLMGICGCFVFGDAPMGKGHANFRVILVIQGSLGSVLGRCHVGIGLLKGILPCKLLLKDTGSPLGGPVKSVLDSLLLSFYPSGSGLPKSNRVTSWILLRRFTCAKILARH